VRRTLFYIPHEIGGFPVFGIGWLLMLWTVIGGVLVWRSMRARGWDTEVRGQLVMMVLIAAAIVWVIPRVEEPIRDGVFTIPPVAAERGLPIRGYGVMLLSGVVLGVALAANRAARAGLHPDAILSLAFAMVLGGMIGARLFFVIQYWSLIRGPTWGETLANLVSVDKGGLVVYGSLVGAMVAFAWYGRRMELPLLPLADLIAPSLALGLALGRIGCLLNGCCFGGPCDLPWAVAFPAGSPPYEDQHRDGVLYGFSLASEPEDRVLVAWVQTNGPFGGTELRAGDQIVAIQGHSVDDPNTARSLLERSGAALQLTLADGRIVSATLAELPVQSVPIHPTQIYSSINASFLCALACLCYPFRRKHGEIMVGMLSAYAVTRFLLEMIRTDEGSFLAQLTISQNISLAMAALLVGLWVYLAKQPRIDASGV
jgi:phosphatidylglycerol:prolipoprotein diacylglycerol transferase